MRHDFSILFFVTVMAIGPTPNAWSHDDEPQPQKIDAKKLYAPTKNPDRIILTWSDNPTSTQTVNWRTDDSVEQGFAEITVAEEGPRFVPKLKRFSATSDQLDSPLGRSKYHHVTFRKLQPATKYVYRVGDGTNWSEFSHFTTASIEPEPFSFVYFGDAQNNIKSHWSRVVRESFKDAPRARFFIHAGDLVNQANNDAEWGEWFYAAGWINRTIPSIATPGNHEYADGKLSKNWQPTFEFPDNGPPALDDTAYYIDYQGARIISLNSNTGHDAQVAWLEKILGGGNHHWTILTFHHPVYSTAKGRDNKRLRETFQPLFDKYHVDLVLQGHDHTYGRTGLVKHGDHVHEKAEDGAGEVNIPAGRNVRGEGGTVYVVSVSGPKMYQLGESTAFVRKGQFKQLYQIVSIDGDTLRYSARTAIGEVYDEFVLKKVSGKPNQLIENRLK